MPDTKPESKQNEFEKAAQEEELSIVGEFFYFLKENKKWWLIPMLLVMGLLGLLAWAGSTGVAPFIYTIF